MSVHARLTKALSILILSAPLPYQAAGQVFSPTSPQEMTELARRYANGVGCPRDAGQAFLWYRRAAAQGEPGAMVAIGDMLKEGRCVDQDLAGAAIWYRRAAAIGFPPAQARYA